MLCEIVNCLLFFFVNQFDWLGEKNQQPYGGDSQKQRPHTLANCCLEQRLSYWWSAQTDFFGTWMKDYWNDSKLLTGAVAELSWRESEVCITEAYLTCTIYESCILVVLACVLLTCIWWSTTSVVVCVDILDMGKIMKHLIVERVISNHLVSWVHIKEIHPV